MVGSMGDIFSDVVMKARQAAANNLAMALATRPAAVPQPAAPTFAAAPTRAAGGGSDMTPYYIAGGVAVLAVGALLVLGKKKKKR